MHSKAAKTDSAGVEAMLAELHRELEVDQDLAEFQGAVAAAMQVALTGDRAVLIRFGRLKQAITEVVGADRDPNWASTWSAYLEHCRPNVYLPAKARVYLKRDKETGEVEAITLPYGVAPFSHFLELPDMHGVTATFEGWHVFERRLREQFEKYDPQTPDDKLWAVRMAAQGLLFPPQELPEFVGEHPVLGRAMQPTFLSRVSDRPLVNAYDPEKHVRMDLEGALRLIDQLCPEAGEAASSRRNFYCLTFKIQDKTA